MIIKNSKLVPKGFIGITIWPFIFLRYDEVYHGGERYTRLVNHEKIHLEQQKELLIIPFYILYVTFALFYGYKNIPFEREAHKFENNSFYLKNRKLFAWIKYF